MSRKKRYVKELNKVQKRSLEKGYKQGKSPIFRRKCQCILKSNDGYSIAELCEFFGVSRQTISTWLNEWEEFGIAGLQLKDGRGRPKKLDTNNEHQVKTIKTLVKNEPKNLKRVLSQVKSKLGVELSKKTLKRFLKNLNTNGNDFVNA